MNELHLEQWANNLSDPEAQLMLLHAAKDHPQRFTNHDDVGMGWYRTLKHNGYNQLPPYARNYLAQKYLTCCEEMHNVKVTYARIPVR